VARALPTTDLGSVYVPNVAGAGHALRAAREAAASGRDVVYATHESVPTDEPFRIEVWDDADPAVLIEVAGPVRAWQRSGRGGAAAPGADGVA
jgi:hypothetical protein